MIYKWQAKNSIKLSDYISNHQLEQRINHRCNQPNQTQPKL